MYKIRKMFKFEAAHALNRAYSKECCSIHGHSYKVEVIIFSNALNDDGMVIDFKLLKEIVGPLIEAFDHKLIVTDRTLCKHVKGQLVVPFNPTAENMAKNMWEQMSPILEHLIPGMIRFFIRVHETDSGYAEYST
jgi:6-pyruvoyltetrahydropterin/6-carboxytetrahydropterin synthase